MHKKRTISSGRFNELCINTPCVEVLCSFCEQPQFGNVVVFCNQGFSSGEKRRERMSKLPSVTVSSSAAWVQLLGITKASSVHFSQRKDSVPMHSSLSEICIVPVPRAVMHSFVWF